MLGLGLAPPFGTAALQNREPKSRKNTVDLTYRLTWASSFSEFLHFHDRTLELQAWTWELQPHVLESVFQLMNNQHTTYFNHSELHKFINSLEYNIYKFLTNILTFLTLYFVGATYECVYGVSHTKLQDYSNINQ